MVSVTTKYSQLESSLDSKAKEVSLGNIKEPR